MRVSRSNSAVTLMHSLLNKAGLTQGASRAVLLFYWVHQALHHCFTLGASHTLGLFLWVLHPCHTQYVMLLCWLRYALRPCLTLNASLGALCAVSLSHLHHALRLNKNIDAYQYIKLYIVTTGRFI